MLRFGAGDSSRRVPFRHTAFRKVWLGLVRLPQLLVRHGHARLAWSLTSFAFRARTRMGALNHSRVGAFVLIGLGAGDVLRHSNPPGGFCSSFLRHSSLPLMVSARLLDVQLMG